MDVFDPTAMEEYGYGRFPNVVTSLEFERLINAGGPTLGAVRAPRRPQGAAARSRSSSASARAAPAAPAKPYCSNVCCMMTIKDTLMLKEHYPDMEITVFYLDIRAFGKGFEDLYTRSREAGVRYLRGLPGLIEEDPATGNLLVAVENTSTGKLERHALRHGRALGRHPAALGQQAPPGDARAAEDLRRLLPRGAPQADAGGLGDPRRLLRRLRRGAQGHQGGGDAGLGGRGALDAPDVARQAADRGADRAGRPGALHRLRDLREGLPLQGDPRRREDQDQGDRHRGGLRRLRHLLGRVPVRRDRHEPLRRPADHRARSTRSSRRARRRRS